MGTSSGFSDQLITSIIILYNCAISVSGQQRRVEVLFGQLTLTDVPQTVSAQMMAIVTRTALPLVLAAVLGASFTHADDAQPGAPHSLRADHLDQPEPAAGESEPGGGADDAAAALVVMGVSLTPTLGWRLHDGGGSARGQKQQSYEIRVLRRLADGTTAPAWESGRVDSSQPEAQVIEALQHQTEYEWQVRVWHEERAPAHTNSIYSMASAEAEPAASPWSEPHVFETLVSTSSWAAANASWIGGGNQLRGDFTIPAGKTLKSARAYVSGLGAFYLYVNGERVGDHIMDPGQTVVTERVLCEPTAAPPHPAGSAPPARLCRPQDRRLNKIVCWFILAIWVVCVGTYPSI